MDILYVIGGLFLLFIGGEGLVRGSVSIATRLGISTFLVGVVIVGFGTSTPELIVSVRAALAGQPDIALGNIVGSNTANILLILGLAAVISPLACAGKDARRDAIIGILAAALLGVLSFTGQLSWIAGSLMVAFLAAYIIYSYRTEHKKNAAALAESAELRGHIEEDVGGKKDPFYLSVIFTIGGLALLMIGARYLVDGAVSIARGFGVSEAVIGLTLVAVGTSLPELAASVIAAIRKHADVAVANILGSNFYNILGILGVTGIIAPIPFEGRIAQIDVWIMLAVSVLLYLIIRLRGNIGRLTGAAFMASYAAYTAWLFTA